MAFGQVDYQGDPQIRDFKATAHGTTLLQMRDLANSVGLGFQMAKRADLAGEVPVPSLIHWSSGHFSALLKAEAGRFFVEDPAFGAGHWISKRALDDEASGFFLVREGPLPKGWRAVEPPEAETVWGMGPTSQSDPQAQTCGDHQSGGLGGGRGECPGSPCPCFRGMANYSYHTMIVGLHVFDTPVGYTPPSGPAVHFGVNYHQQKVFQPQIPTYSNLGPKWTSSWLSYVEDDPTSPDQPVNLYQGGGQETFGSYDPAADLRHHTRSRAQMVSFRRSYTRGVSRTPSTSTPAGRRPRLSEEGLPDALDRPPGELYRLDVRCQPAPRRDERRDRAGDDSRIRPWSGSPQDHAGDRPLRPFRDFRV
jgi:hypothetical protein